jgi:CRP-like cAMP-binding protein
MHGFVSNTECALTGSFLKGRLRERIAPASLARLEAIVGDPHVLADGTRLLASSEKATHASILLDGFMLRVIVKDGRRFIVGINVPGDFVDLHAFVLKRLDHDVIAAGPCRIASVTHERLQQETEQDPELARALWVATLLDAAIHRQWIHNLEALDAPQRIAHLYAELHCRLSLAGHDCGRTLRTPFTQTDLGDMCGISAIHANRAVARLRELGFGEIRRGDLYIRDWAALEGFAGFDPAYLYASAEMSL